MNFWIQISNATTKGEKILTLQNIIKN